MGSHVDATAIELPMKRLEQLETSFKFINEIQCEFMESQSEMNKSLHCRMSLLEERGLGYDVYL